VCLWFDEHGPRRVTFRLPRRLIALETFQAYCVGNGLEGLDVATDADSVIVEFAYYEEDGELHHLGEVPDGWLERIVPVRAELAAGNINALYFGWLIIKESDGGYYSTSSGGGVSRTPPMPIDFDLLSEAEKDLATFLMIDEDERDGANLEWSLTEVTCHRRATVHPARSALTALCEPLSPSREPVLAVAFAPDGRTLATGGRGARNLWLWDVSDATRPHLLGDPLVGHDGPVTAVVFSPDGRTLVTGGGRDQTVRLWDVSDPARPASACDPLTGFTTSVGSLALSVDGRTLAVGDWAGCVRLWNVSDPTRPRPLGDPLPCDYRGATSVTFSPNGHTLTTGRLETDGDTAVRLWDVSDPTRPQCSSRLAASDASWLESNVPGGILTAWAGDGDLLAVASRSYRSLRLWDVHDPTQPRPLGDPFTVTAQADTVTSMTFARHERILAVGGHEGTLRIWDVRDPTKPRLHSDALTGDSYYEEVDSVAFTSDGHLLASAGGPDMKANLWRVHPTTAPKRPAEPTTPALADSTPTFDPETHQGYLF
jgi:WD40 repeat protein